MLPISSVTLHDEKLAQPGLNLFTSRDYPHAYLMDMRGVFVHRWSKSLEPQDTWQYAKMIAGGDLYVICKDSNKLMRLDWQSNLKWVVRLGFHYDLEVAQNGDIYTLTRKHEIVFAWGVPVPVANEYITVLSAEGEVKRQISLFKPLRRYLPAGWFLKIYAHIFANHLRWILAPAEPIHVNSTPLDIFHANHVETARKDSNGLYKKGDFLICIRELDLIGVLDAKKLRMRWVWGPGELDKPHHPSFLDNGHILIFDNGTARRFSRVIEFDPVAGNITWEYRAKNPEQFFSESRGSCQRLPNGNTLITESNRGRVFEVTREGAVVWDFLNPIRRTHDFFPEGSFIEYGVIFRMDRMTDEPRLVTVSKILRNESGGRFETKAT